MTCYIVNRASSTFLDFKTFEEVWSCTTIDHSDLKVFECLAYMLVNDEKLESRIKSVFFLVILSRVKRYRLWCLDPKFSKFMISRHVILL